MINTSRTFTGPAVAALAVAAACLLAACGSPAGQPAVASAKKPVLPSASCSTAVAYAITDAGTAAWGVKLPGAPQGAIPQPVALDGMGVFANGNVLSARRLASGEQAWQRAYPTAGGPVTGPGGGPVTANTGSLAGDVAGLWAWHGELIVVVASFGLSGQDLDMRVQALDPATGAVRWTADLGRGDLYNQMEITANGVLALITEHGGSHGEGQLLAVGLQAGRLLWSRSYGEDEETDGPDAVGRVIVMASGGTVTGFDASTGAVLWSRGRLPDGVGSVAGPGGSVLLYDILQATNPPQAPPAASKLFPVTALSATTGTVLWRTRTAGAVSQLSAADGLIVVGTSQPYRLTVLTPGGHVAWSVPGYLYLPNPTIWTESGGDLVYISSEPDAQGPGIEAGLTMVTDRRLSTGSVRWSIRLADFGADAVVRPDGRNLVVTGRPLHGQSAGALAADPATGAVRAQVLVGPVAISNPVTAGGETLLQAGAVCVPAGPEGSVAPVARASATAG